MLGTLRFLMLTVLPYMAPVELPPNTKSTTSASSDYINSRNLSPTFSDGIDSPPADPNMHSNVPMSFRNPAYPSLPSSSHISFDMSSIPTDVSNYPSVSMSTDTSHSISTLSPCNNVTVSSQMPLFIDKFPVKVHSIVTNQNKLLDSETLNGNRCDEPKASHSKANKFEGNISQSDRPDFDALDLNIHKCTAFLETVYQPIFNTTVGRCAEVAMQIKTSLSTLSPPLSSYPRRLQSSSCLNAEFNALRQMCRIFSSFKPLEDTDSSSSEDESNITIKSSSHSSYKCGSINTNLLPNTKTKKLAFDERYLAERVRSHTHMQWVQSEILQTKCTLDNLQGLHRRLKSHRLMRRQISPPTANADSEISSGSQQSSDVCSRTSAFHMSKRSRYYSSLFCDTLNPAFGGQGARDRSIQCQCRYPECGPCIICCGQRHRSAPLKPIALLHPWNEASTTVRLCPLDSSAHPVMSPFSHRSLHLQVSHRLGNLKYSGRRLHWSQMPWRTSMCHSEVPPSIQAQYAYSVMKLDQSLLPKYQFSNEIILNPLHTLTNTVSPNSLDEKSFNKKGITISLRSHTQNKYLTNTGNSIAWRKSPLKAYSALKHQRRKAAAIKSRLQRSTRLKKNWHIKLPAYTISNNDISGSRLGVQLLDSLRQRRECTRDIPVPGWSFVQEPLSCFSGTSRPNSGRLSMFHVPTSSSVVIDSLESTEVSLSVKKVHHQVEEDTSDEAYIAMHGKEKEAEWERFVRAPSQFNGYRRAMAFSNYDNTFSPNEPSHNSDPIVISCNNPSSLPRRHSVSLSEQTNNIRLRYKPSPRPGFQTLSFPLSADEFEILQDEMDCSE